MGTILVIGIIWTLYGLAGLFGIQKIPSTFKDKSEPLHSLPRDILAHSRDSLDCAGSDNRGFRIRNACHVIPDPCMFTSGICLYGDS